MYGDRTGEPVGVPGGPYRGERTGGTVPGGTYQGERTGGTGVKRTDEWIKMSGLGWGQWDRGDMTRMTHFV